jgi:hypothetical protein
MIVVSPEEVSILSRVDIRLIKIYASPLPHASYCIDILLNRPLARVALDTIDLLIAGIDQDWSMPVFK